ESLAPKRFESGYKPDPAQTQERRGSIIPDSCFMTPITTYGFSDEKFSMRKIQQTPQGNKFLLILDGKVYDGKTKLIGTPNLQNILAAATMSFLLGMSPKTIVG